MNAQWIKLWDCANHKAGEPAQIVVCPDDPGVVVLIWPDGSRAGLIWHDGEWRHAEPGGASDATTQSGAHDPRRSG